MATVDRVQRRALRDIYERSLRSVPDEFDRLMWVASTRDYATGRYHHAGLESTFTPKIAEGALAECHREVFRNLVCVPLPALTDQIERYVESTGVEPSEVIEQWLELRPFAVAVPMHYDRLLADLFLSNVTVALAVLQARHAPHRPDRQFSWPLQ